MTTDLDLSQYSGQTRFVVDPYILRVFLQPKKKPTHRHYLLTRYARYNLLLGKPALARPHLNNTPEANMTPIESQIKDLLCLRDRERGLITALKLVLAPIRKLPSELLVQIFSRAVHSIKDILGNDRHISGLGILETAGS